MKILITCLVMVVSTIAEPPVNRYLPPQGNSGFGPPSTSYGAPGRQTSAIFGARQNGARRPSSQYIPPSNSPSTQYGAPSQFGASSPPSTSYGTPSSQYRSPAPSTQYGTPNVPSNQYGAPARDLGAPSSQYAAPSSQYGAPDTQVRQPSSQYGAPALSGPSGSSAQRAPSTQYGAPSQQYGAPSQQYGTPSQQYGAPSQQYGAPSQEYGAPGLGGNSREQSRQYLPPGSGNGGYGGEDGNGEPANYSFEYAVKDDPSGNDFGHRESRQGDRAEGLYYVLLPDGRKQTVEYEADQDGYKPKISYEDVGQGGYGRGYGGEGGPY